MLTEPRLTYLPDETVYSLACRQHVLWGFSRTTSTSRVLLGSDRRRMLHDFPRPLDVLVSAMNGGAGSAVEAALEHTLLRYYLPFFAEDDRRKALESLRQSGGPCTKSCLALLQSKGFSDHPLKACPVCIRQSVEVHGWTRWQLQLQFPGLWICPQHGEPLLVLHDRWSKSSWPLPRVERLSRSWASGLTDREQDRLAAVGRMVVKAVELGLQDEIQLICSNTALLRIKLDHFGWINSVATSVRMRDAARSWSRYCRPICAAPDFQRLLDGGGEVLSFRGAIADAPQRRVHPLLRLLVIDWLVGDLDVFVHACRSQDRNGLGTRSTFAAWGAPIERAALWRRQELPERQSYARRPSARGIQARTASSPLPSRQPCARTEDRAFTPPPKRPEPRRTIPKIHPN